MDIIQIEMDIRKKILNEIIEELQSYIYTVCIMLQETLDNGGKVIMFGADKDLSVARYFTSELITKLTNTKSILPAIVLNYDLIAIDVFGADNVFEKQIGAIAFPKDMLIGISSDGQNKACLRALSLGKNLGCRVVGFSGINGDIMSEFCDINIALPSENQDIIREMMPLVAGIVSNSLKALFENKENN